MLLNESLMQEAMKLQRKARYDFFAQKIFASDSHLMMAGRIMGVSYFHLPFTFTFLDSHLGMNFVELFREFFNASFPDERRKKVS